MFTNFEIATPYSIVKTIATIETNSKIKFPTRKFKSVATENLVYGLDISNNIYGCEYYNNQ